MPPIAETFYPHTREDWRLWLSQNHQNKKEVWLLYPHKDTHLPCIAYADAVQEAICFGWIDGQRCKFDETFSCQRWTPRSAASSWSELNKHLARLALNKGIMTPAGLKTLPDLNPNTFVIPPLLLQALKKDRLVWKHFCAFPPHYQRIRLDYIIRRMNRPALYKKALEHFIKQTRDAKLYGPFKNSPDIY